MAENLEQGLSLNSHNQKAWDMDMSVNVGLMTVPFRHVEKPTERAGGVGGCRTYASQAKGSWFHFRCHKKSEQTQSLGDMDL